MTNNDDKVISEVWWIRADGQQEMGGGSFDSLAEAEARLYGFADELQGLAQTAEQADETLNGHFLIVTHNESGSVCCSVEHPVSDYFRTAA